MANLNELSDKEFILKNMDLSDIYKFKNPDFKIFKDLDILRKLHYLIKNEHAEELKIILYILEKLDELYNDNLTTALAMLKMYIEKFNKDLLNNKQAYQIFFDFLNKYLINKSNFAYILDILKMNIDKLLNIPSLFFIRNLTLLKTKMNNNEQQLLIKYFIKDIYD